MPPTRIQLTALVCLLGLAPAALAQQPKEVPEERKSPRATYLTFKKLVALKALDAKARADARACLNLDDIDEGDRERIGDQRVIQLKKILEHITVREALLSPDSNLKREEPIYTDLAGQEKHSIVLARYGKRGWLFTQETIDTVPDLLTALEARKAALARGEKSPGTAPPPEGVPGAVKKEKEKEKTSEGYEHVEDWMRAHMPEELQGQAFLLEYWQWAGLGVLLFVGLLLHWLMIHLMVRAIIAALKRRGLEVEAKRTRHNLRPFGFLVMAAFWWIGIGWLGLHADVEGVITVIIETIVVFAVVWGLYNVVDIVGDAMERKAAKSKSKFDDLLVPLVSKSLKVFVVAFGLVFIADTLELSVKSLLAGLGLGGLAFALAAQDTVKNFFGSLTVVLDRPFEVGDWVLIDKVEGSVEELGFRSTRIRTFYNSIITLPNSKLLTANIDNMGKRRYRRWKTTLGVTYDTPPESLEALCEGIRELIRSHPNTRKDYFQVYVTALADSAIEILVYTFFETPDWTRELKARQKMILDILRLARRLSVEMAFPTQTVHMIPPSVADEDPEKVASGVPAAVDIGRLAAQAIVAQGEADSVEEIDPEEIRDPGGQVVPDSSEELEEEEDLLGSSPDATAEDDPLDEKERKEAVARATAKPVGGDTAAGDMAAVSDEADGGGNGDG